MKPNRKRTIYLICLAVLAGVLWKTFLLLWGKFPFNADEAVVALMARHILAGSRPVFFYGQAYMGSLDAYLVAGGFALFGQHVWVIRFVQIILFVLVQIVSTLVAIQVSGRKEAGVVTAFILAVPAVNMTLYTTVSLGGYNEALLIGVSLCLSAFQLAGGLMGGWRFPKTAMLVFLWGILAGVGIWANGITFVFILPTAVYIAYSLLSWATTAKTWRYLPGFIVSAAAGLVAGSFPYWFYAITNGAAALSAELFGSAVSVETGSFLALAAVHLRNLVLLGLPALLGIRPPWEVRWLFVPLLPVVLVFWGWVVARGVGLIRKDSQRRIELLALAGVCIVLFLGFVFTPFGVDPSGRYFLPVYTVLAILAGVVLVDMKKPAVLTALALLLAFHVGSTVQCALKDPPAITTQFYAPSIIDHSYDQALIRFLEETDETHGYTSYWVAYPLAFLSKEELIFIPRLPYHPDMRYTERDDRYAPYTARVESSEKTAYITANHETLNDSLRRGFRTLDVRWKEEVIGDYTVFYALSRAVKPGEMGLGFSQ